MDQSINNFLEIIQAQLALSIAAIDPAAVETAARLILNSERNGGRVHACGIGKPGHVAGYIASLLSSTGTSTYQLDATEAVHGSSGQVRPGDVVIAISNSGETTELKAAVETLINNGAKIISCTGNAASWLARHSEVCLSAHVDQEGDRLNMPPRASILAEILVLQCLSISLQSGKKLDPDHDLRWHPGGSLGHCLRTQKENRSVYE